MNSQNQNENNSDILTANSIITTYLLPNWFHTARQPLNIISASAGYLQILTISDSYEQNLFNNKLQELQNQSQKTEELLNSIRTFISPVQALPEKVSLHLIKMFELMSRDFTCWSIENKVEIINDFQYDKTISLTLVICAIYKAFGTMNTTAKTAYISINSQSKNCTENNISDIDCLFTDSSQNELLTAIKKLKNYCIGINLTLDFKNQHLNITIGMNQ